jgi:hypothetical protein
VGDAKAGSRSARAGTKRGSIRRRAVGTRDRIISHLTAVDEVSDPTGMASTRLAEAVGYPGSSVAFAQLLSGMERDGLIIREVRGKRTYRITLPAGVVSVLAASRAAHADGKPAASDDEGDQSQQGGPAPATGGVDYDELARRLLVQVVRRLAGTSGAISAADFATVDVAGAVAETMRDDETVPDEAVRDETVRDETVRDETAILQETVADLERELAAAWTRHGTLSEENARLREQLREAQRDLARERTRKASITDDLDHAEVVLLERLLSPSRDGEGERPAAAN